MLNERRRKKILSKLREIALNLSNNNIDKAASLFNMYLNHIKDLSNFQNQYNYIRYLESEQLAKTPKTIKS